MQNIPIRAYARTEQAYPKLPYIASIVFPNEKEYQRNTEAAPGAKVIYLFNQYAKEVCKEKVDSVTGIVQNAPWLFDGMPEKCCLHCKHFVMHYRSTSAERFMPSEYGRCCASGHVHGKAAKASGCCDRFEFK